MNSDQFKKLFTKYVEGTASAAETALVEQFFNKYEKEVLNEPNPYTENETLKEQIYLSIKRANEKKRKQIQSSWQIAAAITALISIGTFTWYNVAQPKAVAHRFVQTFNGERSTLTLEDGSIVMLNANSSLEFPEHFSDSVRMVNLQGEAYFKVAKNKEVPFKVKANGVTTTVLGTQFNINSYEQDSLVSIALLEGSVKVCKDGNSTILEPLEKAIFNRKSGGFKTSVFDSLSLMAWTNNKLVFNNSSLTEVATQIKRIYNLQVVFAEPELAHMKINGRFSNENAGLVLTAITRAHRLDFRKTDDKTIEIYVPKNP